MIWRNAVDAMLKGGRPRELLCTDGGLTGCA